MSEARNVAELRALPDLSTEAPEAADPSAERVAELERALAERTAVLAELRSIVALELDRAELRVALVTAQAQVQVVAAHAAVEKAHAAVMAEKAARTRAEVALGEERARVAAVAEALASVPWWAPWRRRQAMSYLPATAGRGRGQLPKLL
jgi:hypothetical protein